MEFGGSDLARRTLDGRQGSAGVPNAGAVYCPRRLGIEPSEVKSCHLFLEVDHVSDNRHYCLCVPSKSNGK